MSRIGRWNVDFDQSLERVPVGWKRLAVMPARGLDPQDKLGYDDL